MQEKPRIISKQDRIRSRMQSLLLSAPGIDNNDLEVFKKLPEEIQVNVIRYVDTQRSEGFRGKDLYVQVRTFIMQSRTLNDMNETHSDRYYHSKEDLLRAREREEAKRFGDETGGQMFDKVTKPKGK